MLNTFQTGSKNLHISIDKDSKIAKKLGAYHSKTGTFHNPYRFDEYKHMVNRKTKYFTNASLNNVLLYNKILKYKQKMCEFTVRIFNKALIYCESFVRISSNLYCNNGYPCVMIKLPFFEGMKRNTKNEILNIENWNQILIAYYIAIVNNLAYRERIPIELVIRSSFGHNGPTIDVTAESFRINIGVIPRRYAEILGRSAVDLIDIFESESPRGKPRGITST